MYWREGVIKEEAQAPTNYHEPNNRDNNMDPSNMFAAMFAANQEPVKDQNNVASNGTERACSLELENYKSISPPAVQNRYMNVLGWWKDLKNQFPNLAKLARKYLSIQASSAPSKQIFSKAGNIISEKQTILGPNIAGKILYVSQNYEWFEKANNDNDNNSNRYYHTYYYMFLFKDIHLFNGHIIHV